MRVTVKEEKAVKISCDPDHPPPTQGVLCTKVTRYAERTHHKDRLLTPLRRVGRKARVVSSRSDGWDEALNIAAERLKTIARRASEAILPYSYAGTMGLVQDKSIAARFCNVLGAARLDRTICAAAETRHAPSTVFLR